MLSTAQGFQNLLKDGYRHYSGVEEAILRNIEACREIAAITRTSLGPRAMKKMVVNHLDKIFVTSDCAVMLKELEVQHPAARLLMLAAQMQEEDFGDATNYVVTLAGELLSQAEQLIKGGLHPSAIVSGFEAGLTEACRTLEALCHLQLDVDGASETLEGCMAAVLAPKLPSALAQFSAGVVGGCRIALRAKTPRFDADDFRVVKVIGGDIEASALTKGFVVARAPETATVRVERAVVAVFNCPFDPQSGETKGTVLFGNAKELLGYAATEEALAARIVSEVVATGANVVVVGGSIAELCLHFLQQHAIFVLRLTSKFDLQRLARCVNATPLARLGAPTKDELGYADLVELRELGSTRVTVIEKASDNSRLASLVVRGGTRAQMDELERAVRKGVNFFKAALSDNRFVFGAGATEAFLARRLERFGATLSGLEQYACAALGQALEVVPRTLIENAGLPADQLEALLSANAEAPAQAVDVFNARLADAAALGVFDHRATKLNALRLAVHAAVTVLRVDQIIMAKPSGGPKMAPKKDWDAEE